MPKHSEHVILDDVSQLRAIPDPVTTKTYKGVPHHLVYDLVQKQAHKEGYDRLRDTLEITHGGERAFMNLQFGTDDPNLPFSIAMRSTYDRSAAFAIASGASVFICSNLMISGSDITLKKAHKGTIVEELEDMIARAFGSGKQSYKDKVLWRETSKQTELTVRQGEYLLAMAKVEGVFTSSAYASAREHWLQAPFDEFRDDRSVWGLYNAMTWGSHKIRPSNKMEAHQNIVDFAKTILVEDQKLVIA